jgi:hypothetical protein
VREGAVNADSSDYMPSRRPGVRMPFGSPSEQEGVETAWRLYRFVRYLESKDLAWEEEVPIHQLAVHPYHFRYVPVKEMGQRFAWLVRLAESRLLFYPLIVTSVDSNIVKILKYISEEAEKRGRNSEDVLAGILWRRVKLEGDEIVAREDDEVYSAVSKYHERKGMGEPDGRIKYLIIDGYSRYVAACEVYVKKVDSWKDIPVAPSIVLAVDAETGLDPVSAAFYSIALNVAQEQDLVDRLPPHIEEALGVLPKMPLSEELRLFLDSLRLKRTP